MSLPPERMALVDADVAYLVGKGGATRARLENFSGARLVIDHDSAEISGNDEERALVKLAINITLQQREHGAITVNFDSVETRPDVSTMDVPKQTVGFLLGSKGGTLRDIETRHHTFMFFDNERIRENKSGPCKRLYVIGRDGDRQRALDEAEDIVRFKLTGQGNGPRRLQPDTGYQQRDDRGGLMPPRFTEPHHDDRGPPPSLPAPPHARFDERDRERDYYYDRRGPPPSSALSPRGAPPPPRYADEPPPRYADEPPPRYADELPPRYADEPPPRYDERYERAPPPNAPRYDDRAPPPPRYADDRAPPPPRYADDRGHPPPQYDERERDYYYERRGPPPTSHMAPPTRFAEDPRYDRGPPPPRYDERYERAPTQPRYDERERDYYYDRAPPPQAAQRGQPRYE